MGTIENRERIRDRLYEIIFEADTRGGKLFDVWLLIAILMSIVAVMLESVVSIDARFGDTIRIIEWILTVLFTLEYLLRIYCVRKPMVYVFSFFGVVDFLATIPTYLTLFFVGTQFLVVIRTIRLLRVFRIFKLGRYLNESRTITRALKASRPKITVFLGGVGTLVVILGTLMYVIEGAENGFTSIPRSIYWAIVTLTTVGYGDIAPQTISGQFLASLVMIMGYSIIAVPTGIVSVEIARASPARQLTTQTCPSCLQEGHDEDAVFCKYCGGEL